jgi:DNA-binding transcriptional MerR regulator
MSDMTGAGNVDKAPDAFRTISEVADDLDVPQHVLRFWETRFSQIKPMKRGGGRRYYRPEDVDLLRGIRHLLYGEGYTIRGVQRILKDNGLKFVQSVWRSGAPQPEPPRAEDAVGSEDGVERLAPDDAGRDKGREEPAGRAQVGASSMQETKPPSAPSLSLEDVRKLHSTLHELGECRRLLEVALKDE